MNKKRFYKKTYGDEYYVFDSHHTPEKEFTAKYKLAGYEAFKDSLTGDETIKLLNRLHEENKQYNTICNQQKKEIQTIKDTIQKLYETERTSMGKTILKQVINAIGE